MFVSFSEFGCFYEGAWGGSSLSGLPVQSFNKNLVKFAGYMSDDLGSPVLVLEFIDGFILEETSEYDNDKFFAAFEKHFMA